MARLQLHINTRLNWKWWGAFFLFSCGFLGFLSGVDVSERPGLPQADALTKAYYAFGLFVLGGLDLGTPINGPLYGRVLLWTAYFGAPILTASAVIEAVLHTLHPHSLRLRRIKDHIVIAGTGDLSFYLIRKIREYETRKPILLIANERDNPRFDELRAYRNISIILSVGDHRYLMRRIRMHRANRILLLSDNDHTNFDAASGIIEDSPELAERIVLHISDLGLLKLVQDTEVGLRCKVFNSYQLAATHLLAKLLSVKPHRSSGESCLAIIGFGHFGHSILEKVKQKADENCPRVVIVDPRLHQLTQTPWELFSGPVDHRHHLIEGGIEEPDIWKKLLAQTAESAQLMMVVATGDDLKNIRVSIALRQTYSDALIISRNSRPSALATQLCSEHGIHNVNVAELLEDAISERWFLG